MLQVQMRLEGRTCLVVGGGTVGTRRTRALLEAGAEVVVIDPAPSPELEALVLDGADDTATVRLELLRRNFVEGDVAGIADPRSGRATLGLVVAATDDPDRNATVGAEAQVAGVLVNRADDAASGDLAFPAVVRRGPVAIGVSTSTAGPDITGTSEFVPALARWVARRIDEGVDELIGLDETALTHFAQILAEVRRGHTGDKGGTAENTASSGLDWHLVFDGSILELVQAGRLVEAKEKILACL